MSPLKWTPLNPRAQATGCKGLHGQNNNNKVCDGGI